MSKENWGKNRQVENKMTEIDSQIENEKNWENSIKPISQFLQVRNTGWKLKEEIQRRVYIDAKKIKIVVPKNDRLKIHWSSKKAVKGSLIFE